MPSRLPGLAAGLPSLVRALVALLALAQPLLAAPSSSGSGTTPPSVHTELSRATPAAGSEVPGPVTEIRLLYTTAVQLPLSRVSVEGPDGVERLGALDLVDDSEGRELRLSLPGPLPTGVQRVLWQTAGPDGHVIRGEFLFTVLATAAGPAPTAAPGAGAQAADTLADTVPPGTADTAGAEAGAVGAPLPADTVPAGPGEAPVGPGPGGVEDRLAGAASEAVAEAGGAAGLTFRWLQYLGTLLLVGSVAFRMGVVPRLMKESTLAPAAAAVTARLATLALTGGIVLAISMPGRLWVQAVATWGGEVAVGELATLVFRTPWGWGWLIQGAAVVVALFGVRLAAPAGGRAGGWTVVALGALAAALVPSLSGHAWGIEPRFLGVLLSTGHVAGVGIWIGGLACLLLAGIPGMKAVKGEGGTLPGLGSLVNGFSRIALPAVALVLVTGVGQNAFHLGNPGNFLVTGWGRMLLVKLGLVAAAMALGLYNWRVVRPALKESPRAGLLRIPATVEFLLGLAVLVATALLVVRSIPGGGGAP